VNLFSGSPLNRVSWLRSSHIFLNAAVDSPATRWVLFNAGRPLVAPNATSSGLALAYLSTPQVSPLLGTKPYFGQDTSPGSALQPTHVSPHTEAIRHLPGAAPLVFLGIHESNSASSSALPSSDFADPEQAIANIAGQPFFAMDVAALDMQEEELARVLGATGASQNDPGAPTWADPRTLMMASIDPVAAAIFAEARSMCDWNLSNKFCPACGSRNYSAWGGWKLVCSSLMPWADNTGRKPCATARGLHNFKHPRTDPVVIMIAIDETGDKILLGKNKKFPGNFYSALAGFMEPGESLEDAVVREMWEEAGVKVWNVRYHSGQPWPFPANLMLGFYARADASQPVRVDLDNELADARWYTRDEVNTVLSHPKGSYLSSRDNRKLGAETDKNPASRDFKVPEEEAVATPNQEDELSPPPSFVVPPAAAIAGVLIRDWASGRIGFSEKAAL
ncbi:hypothetical protein FISHEDRAFT_35431, partial [Fistulina hepatica ATCC 64428]